jgi:glycosyltransferase involved in cell wall biosynthesis
MKQKHKIVFISYFFWPPYFGGELKIAIERFISLSQRGYEIVIFTSGVPGYPRKEIRDGLQIYRSPLIGNTRIARRFNRLIFWLWLYLRFLFERSVKVVHIETITSFLGVLPSHFYAWLLLLIAKWKHTRSICVHSLASTEQDYFVTRNRWEKKYYQTIDIIVCVSEALYQAVRVYHPKAAVLEPCGIHDEIFVPLTQDERQEIRSQNMVHENDIVFSFIGSFEKRKGLDLLVDSFIKNCNGQNWKLWLFGPFRKAESQYIHEEEVLELIAPLEGLDEQVQYWGRVDDRHFLAKLLASSDIFVFPTRREGFGIAPLEAMSCGIPVVVSRIPGITDMGSIDHVTGIYIQPGNQQELEAAMIKLARDSNLRKQMGKQGRKRITEDFSWEKHIDHWESIYAG